jgi:hypothetical protein
MPESEKYQDANEGAMRTPQNFPAPDPTARTTQQVLRENFWLRELLETRLNAMDKALLLLQAFADRTPTTSDVAHSVAALREVTTEKFAAIAEKFRDIASQTDKASREVKSAVDAAFAAAKEAVSEQNKSNTLAVTKSEATVNEQLRSQALSTAANLKNVEDKIADLKDRLTIIESKTGVSDPSTAMKLAGLDVAVAKLASTGDVSSGIAAGKAALWALILGGVSLLVGAGSMVAMLMRSMG